MKTLNQSIHHFCVLVSREWLVYKKRLPGFLVSFLIVSPTTFAIMQGYFKPLMYFGYPLGRKAVLVFAGALIMRFIHRAFNFATSFFFDVHKNKTIQYQAQGVPLFIVYISKVFVSFMMTWMFMLPLLPCAKLYLQGNLLIPNVSWGSLFGVMGLVSWMINAYAFMCVSAVSTFYGISKIRVRLNEILMWLGAFNATWVAIARSGKVWGIVGLLNPFTYATEAFRQSIVPGADLLPFFLTIPALCIWSIMFIVIGYRFLQRHIWAGGYLPKYA